MVRRDAIGSQKASADGRVNDARVGGEAAAGASRGRNLRVGGENMRVKENGGWYRYKELLRRGAATKQCRM